MQPDDRAPIPHPVPTGADPAVSLPLTGERTVPGITEETYWFERHVVAYDLAAVLVAEAVARADTRPVRVLDAGCGEGYGLARLAAAGATRVDGIEVDPHVAAHARARYAAADPRVNVHEADVARLPLADRSVEVAVSLQVVEHLDRPEAHLAELRRVLAPGGSVLVATPNRRTLSPDGVTLNPFHVREYAAEELDALLLTAGLVPVARLAVHHGPRLEAAAAAHGVDLLATLVATGPEAWPAWLAALVPTVTAADFTVTATDRDRCLDLVVRCVAA